MIERILLGLAAISIDKVSFFVYLIYSLGNQQRYVTDYIRPSGKQ